MDNNLDAAANSLAEQTKKLEIASFYTHGDFQRAKEMVSGSYKDQYAIKGRFSSSSVYGAFILFFNTVYKSLVHLYMIVSPSFNIEDMKTNSNWRIFEQEIADAIEKGEHDNVLITHLREELGAAFTHQFADELSKLIEQNDAISVNHQFKKFVTDYSGLQNIRISIDYEPVSSLEMELFSKSSKKVNPNELPGAKAEAEKKKKIESIEKVGESEDNPLDGKAVKLILKGSLILSPIKGKDIGLLEAGDRVMLKIVDKNPKGISVAKAFNAYSEEDGTMKPLKGRIVAMKRSLDGVYNILAVVAKGIYIKVEEEEENIKVAIDQPASDSVAKKAGEAKVTAPVIIILCVVFLLLVGLVIFFVS